jgi:hypothetical protein
LAGVGDLISPMLNRATTAAPAADGAQTGAGDADRVGEALGLSTRSDFLKMLVLALLAGFAERLAPGILNRLSKRTAWM